MDVTPRDGIKTNPPHASGTLPNTKARSKAPPPNMSPGSSTCPLTAYLSVFSIFENPSSLERLPRRVLGTQYVPVSCSSCSRPSKGNAGLMPQYVIPASGHRQELQAIVQSAQLEKLAHVLGHVFPNVSDVAWLQPKFSKFEIQRYCKPSG